MPSPYTLFSVLLFHLLICQTSLAYTDITLKVHDSTDLEFPNSSPFPKAGLQYFGGLTIIRSITSQSGGGGGVTKRVLQRTHYYRSQNPASWDEAVQKCELVRKRTPAYVESRKESDGLKRLLATLCCRSPVYWIGGEYNVARKRFQWTNGDSFDRSLKWESGHPNMPPTESSKVALSTGDMHLVTRNRNETFKFICKLAHPEIILTTSYLSAYPLNGTGTKWETDEVSP